MFFSFSLSLKSALSRQLKCIINSLKLCINCTQRITDNWKLLRVGDKYFPREENTDWWSNSKQPWKHFTNITQTEQVILRLWRNMQICMQNNQKGRPQIWGGVYRKVWREERRGKWCDFIIISKVKNNSNQKKTRKTISSWEQTLHTEFQSWHSYVCLLFYHL